MPGQRYGFEPEDIVQEKAIGTLLSQRTKPGDEDAARSRSKVRVGRYKKKEREWNRLRVPIKDLDRTVDGLQFEMTLLHEIMDLLPYTAREEVLKSLLEGDGRKIKSVGRMVREMLPGLAEESS